MRRHSVAVDQLRLLGSIQEASEQEVAAAVRTPIPEDAPADDARRSRSQPLVRRASFVQALADSARPSSKSQDHEWSPLTKARPHSSEVGRKEEDRRSISLSDSRTAVKLPPLASPDEPDSAVSGSITSLGLAYDRDSLSHTGTPLVLPTYQRASALSGQRRSSFTSMPPPSRSVQGSAIDDLAGRGSRWSSVSQLLSEGEAAERRRIKLKELTLSHDPGEPQVKDMAFLKKIYSDPIIGFGHLLLKRRKDGAGRDTGRVSESNKWFEEKVAERSERIRAQAKVLAQQADLVALLPRGVSDVQKRRYEAEKREREEKQLTRNRQVQANIALSCIYPPSVHLPEVTAETFMSSATSSSRSSEEDIFSLQELVFEGNDTKHRNLKESHDKKEDEVRRLRLPHIPEDRNELCQVWKLIALINHKKISEMRNLLLRGIPYLIYLGEPENGLTALHFATLNNDTVMVKELLEFGAAVNIKDSSGRNPIMLACEKGYLEILEIFLDSQNYPDVSMTDNEGKGVLFYCLAEVDSQHERCCELCLHAHADAGNVNRDGCSVLVQACRLPNTEISNNIINMLLKHGADPNTIDPVTTQTALYFASCESNARAVRLLLEYGADVNYMAEPEDYAELKQNKNCNIHAAHEAAKRGQLEILVTLSAFGADFSRMKTRIFKETPLHWAVKYCGHLPIIKFLLYRGVNGKVRANRFPKSTAFQLSIQHGCKQRVKQLCRRSTKWKQIPGKARLSPWLLQLYDWIYVYFDDLYLRIREAQQKAREQKKSGDDNEVYQGGGGGKVGGLRGQKNDKKKKPANVMIKRKEIVSILHDFHSPLDTQSKIQQFLDTLDPDKTNFISFRRFLTGIPWVPKRFRLPRKRIPKAPRRPRVRRRRRWVNTVRVPPFNTIPTLISGEADVSVGQWEAGQVQVPVELEDRVNRGWPGRVDHPLHNDSVWYVDLPGHREHRLVHDAIKSRNIDLIHSLTPSKLDHRDKYHRTPLMVAVSQGHYDLVLYLIDKGVDINAKDNFQWTPLHYACHMAMASLDIVQTLVAHGANVLAKSWSGKSPCDMALNACKIDVVAFLNQIEEETEKKKRRRGAGMRKKKSRIPPSTHVPDVSVAG